MGGRTRVAANEPNHLKDVAAKQAQLAKLEKGLAKMVNPDSIRRRNREIANLKAQIRELRVGKGANTAALHAPHRQAPVTEAEAKKWVGQPHKTFRTGKTLKLFTFHYGTPDHVHRIENHGVDLTRNFKSLYGKGFYMFATPQPNNRYGKSGLVVATKMKSAWVGTKNQFETEIRKMSDAHPEWHIPRWGGLNMGGAYIEHVPEWFKSQGYDGLVIKNADSRWVPVQPPANAPANWWGGGRGKEVLVPYIVAFDHGTVKPIKDSGNSSDLVKAPVVTPKAPRKPKP